MKDDIPTQSHMASLKSNDLHDCMNLPDKHPIAEKSNSLEIHAPGMSVIC